MLIAAATCSLNVGICSKVSVCSANKPPTILQYFKTKRPILQPQAVTASFDRSAIELKLGLLWGMAGGRALSRAWLLLIPRLVTIAPFCAIRD